MSVRRVRGGGRRPERLLVLAALFCLGRAGVLSLEAAMFQWSTGAVLRQDVALQPPAVRPQPAVAATAPAPAAREVLGLLEIPRVGMSTVVVEGDEARTLSVAAGHLPDTPLPWEPGNSAIAGHRDTFFRALREIDVGDVIELATRRGRLSYRVLKLLVVDPDDVWVLAPSSEVDLTLITCYPFTYIGSAPHRFIVQATRQATPSVSGD
jgi:sortase A